MAWITSIVGVICADDICAHITNIFSNVPDFSVAGYNFRFLASPEFATKIADRILHLAAGLLPVLLVELWVVGYDRSSLARLTTKRKTSGMYDLGLAIIGIVGLSRLWGIIATLGAGYFVGLASNHVLSTITGLNFQIRTGYEATDLILYFLAFTFFDYVCHRTFHQMPFWHLHRMHHSATEMTTLTLGRSHPGANLLDPIFKVWPLALFAAPPYTILIITYGVMGYEYLIHSNVPWTWGWFGRWVLIPPAGHRLHHSLNPVHAGKLLGIIPLWDRLFGTWCDVDEKTITQPVGVAETYYNSGSILREIFQDFVLFARSTWQMLARRHTEPRAIATERK
jgi:sterol desaturase/sphingolipid hydroxylase (fatty acid hydroxylase superfamily)